MGKQAGVWIDHKRAVIVTLEGEQHEVCEIWSEIEKRVRFRGGARPRVPYSPQFLSGETQKDRQFVQRLRKFYAEVASAIGEAEALLIFGPGEAKFEFHRHLRQRSCRFSAIQIEAADKMTNRQILARVRKYFNPPKKTARP